ncbi:hypothetical protein [Emcibacter sp. SYSU 3D8]|uniref:hypothetical protein n=1 Tax=Emcibacter sp. SYSU 3D8 TaxID=3133969 RepID=UPI0031FF09C9
MKRMRLTTLVAFAAMTLLAACATEPPRQQTGADATVINRTGRAIASISYQPCGAAANAWMQLPMPAIPPQTSAPFRLPEACTNLRAHFADGQLAGMHTGVKWNFPFTWVVS